MPSLDRRDQFLIEMYNQLMNEISRHIMVTWQSIATLVAALAAFTLIKEKVISYDIAVSVILIVCIWFIAHVYDSSFWYNRNLAIIANIERQFLKKSDLCEIHYYFGKHRPKNKMISHLLFQKIFALSIAFMALLTHFIMVICPALGGIGEFNHKMLIPWIVLVIGVIVWILCHRDGKSKYESFLKNSPGREIDASDVQYNNGHGF